MYAALFLVLMKVGVTVLILWEGNSSTEVKWIVLNHTGEWEILDFLSILP